MASEDEAKAKYSTITRNVNITGRILSKLITSAEEHVSNPSAINFRTILEVKLVNIRETLKKLKDTQNIVLQELAAEGFAETLIDRVIDEHLAKVDDFQRRIIPLEELSTRDLTPTGSLGANFPPERNDVLNNQSTIPLKIPNLKLPNFEKNINVTDYINFASQFKSTLDAIPNLREDLKFIYLKNSLKGRALSLVEGFPVTLDSYKEAWELLDKTFLDEKLIINSCLADIVNAAPCRTLTEVETFLDMVLKKQFELSNLQVKLNNNDNDLGNLLFSHIIRSKLSKQFLQEVIRTTKTSYPDALTILEVKEDIIKLFRVSERSAIGESAINKEKLNASVRPKKNEPVELSGTPGIKNNFDKQGRLGCKFCNRTNHSSLHCKIYNNCEARTKRACELQLCSLCLSSKHKAENCWGRKGKLGFSCSSCGQSSHTTPMCPRPQLSFSASKVNSKTEHTK